MTSIPYFLLSLLLLAHVAADRLSITESRARAAGSVGQLGAHALQVGLFSALVLLFGYSRLIFAPQASPPTLSELGILLMFIGMGHFGLDLLHMQIDGAEPREVRSDLADQLLHLGVMVAGVSLLSRFHVEWQHLAAGDLIILGQTVSISTFGQVAAGIGLVVWAVAQGLKTQLTPAAIASSSALRVIVVMAAYAGPLWPGVLFCGGACAWQFRRERAETTWLQLAGLAILAFALRALRPA